MVDQVKKRILFVDDELQILRALKRMLRDRRGAWDIVFAEGGQEGLELLAKESFDVVVSDMRMPEMDGAQFLFEVKSRYPDTGRLVLSGQSDTNLDIRVAGAAHQYLAKPCDANQLKRAIDRTLSIRGELNNQQLRSFVSGLSTIPSQPSVLTKLAHALDDAESDDRRVADIVVSDLGITAKVLQLVNSEFFGSGRVVSDPRIAVELLGQETIQSLVSSMDMFGQAERLGLNVELFLHHWEHGLEVAALAKQISYAEGVGQAMASEAFTAGMLHDIGKILLLANTCEYETILAEHGSDENELSLCRLEEATFGVNHAQVGAYLLGIWGLPDTVVEAVLYHHRPQTPEQRVFSPLTAVHAANYMARQMSDAVVSELRGSYNQSYLNGIGCGAKMSDWMVIGDISSSEGLLNKILQLSE